MSLAVECGGEFAAGCVGDGGELSFTVDCVGIDFGADLASEARFEGEAGGGVELRCVGVAVFFADSSRT